MAARGPERTPAPTKRTALPEGLIRLAALGTWPYPFCPFGTFPLTGGIGLKGRLLGVRLSGLSLQGKVARPKAVTDEVFPSIHSVR